VVRDQVADEAPIERNASAWDGGIEHDDVGGVLIDAADRRAPGHHHLDHGLHAGSDASGDLRRLVAMQLGGGEAERSRDLEDLAGRVVPKDADRHGVVWNDRQDRSRYLDVDAATRRGTKLSPIASTPAQTAAIASAGRVIPQIFTNTAPAILV